MQQLDGTQSFTEPGGSSLTLVMLHGGSPVRYTCVDASNKSRDTFECGNRTSWGVHTEWRPRGEREPDR